MADMNDPFAAFGTDSTPTEPLQSKVQPFTDAQRFIVQNFFDTNEAARKKYLKQLGYEMQPGDDNMIRAIGTQGAYAPIDPGFSDAYKKGGLTGVAGEFLKDVGDVAYDATDIGTKVMAAFGAGTAGGVPGAAAGTAAGPVGSAVGFLTTGIPAAMVGAAASGALTNSAKQKIRDAFLDEDMPFDAKEMAVDAALSAAGAGLFGGAAKGFRKLKDFDLTTRIDGIKNALKAAGNVADPDLIERAAREPELFTEKAVDGGRRRLYEATKNIFGIEEGEQLRDIKDLKRIRPDSYFGKIISPMAEMQEKAVQALSLDPKASVSYQDAKGQLGQLYSALEQKVLMGNPTQAEEEAFKVVGDQLKNLRNMAASNIGKKPGEAVSDAALQNVTFNYGQARDFLNGFQDRAFNVTTKTSNPLVRQAAGGMRSYLDDVAEKSGNEIGQILPQLNKRMSETLDDYNTAKDLIGSSDKIMRAYVGKPGERALEVQDFMGLLDQKYGTKLAKDFDAGAAQAVFEEIYKGAPAKGSSRVNAFMVGETAKGAMTGGTAGAAIGGLTGVGAMPGAVGGAVLGGARAARQAATLAQPEQGLRALGGMLEQQAARNAMDPTQLAIRDALMAGAGAGALSQVGGVQGNAPEDDDPFAAFGQ